MRNVLRLAAREHTTVSDLSSSRWSRSYSLFSTLQFLCFFFDTQETLFSIHVLSFLSSPIPSNPFDADVSFIMMMMRFGNFRHQNCCLLLTFLAVELLLCFSIERDISTRVRFEFPTVFTVAAALIRFDVKLSFKTSLLFSN